MSAITNRLYGRLIVEALRRCGCHFFCISPGSRSTPLTLGASETGGITPVLNHDERGAGFTAMGYGCAGGSPGVLICTSGTAAANYLPAVCEADAAGVPMIILTADRPLELQRCGANQTIDQNSLFGSRLRWFRQLPAPDDNVSPELWLGAVSEAFAHSTGPNPGPVQLNLPFREPLVDEESGPTHTWPVLLELAGISNPDLRRWLDGDTPWRETIFGNQLQEATVQRLCKTIEKANRPLIVAGSIRNGQERRATLRLAEQLNCPILCDVQSGLSLTGGGASRIISHADALLRSSQFRNAIDADLIIQVGARIVSKRTNQFLAASTCNLLRFSTQIDDDPAFRRGQVVSADLVDTFSRLTRLVAPAPWSLTDWNARADERIRDVEYSEIAAARAIATSGSPDRVLWLGSSMPVRDVDTWAPSSNWGDVGAARGVSGIDGTLSAALGFSRGCHAAVTVLMGDVTALHDLNALQQAAEHPWPVCIVIINNDGGGIFSQLPIRDAAPDAFEPWFGTPHGRSFESAAKMFGLEYRSPVNAAELTEALVEAQSEGDPTIIELQFARDQQAQVRQDLATAFDSLI